MRQRAALLLLLVVAAPFLVFVSARSSAAAARLSLALVDQTQVVDPEGSFLLDLQLQGVPPSDAEIDVSTYAAVTDRGQLQRAFAGQLGKALTAQPLRFPLATLTLDPTGQFDITIAVSASTGKNRTALVLPRVGVYPIAVTLGDGQGQTLDRFVTVIVRGSGQPASHPVAVAFLLPITSEATLGPDLTPRPLANEPKLLSDYTDVLATHTSPVTVIPAPDLLEAMTATEDGQATLLRFDQTIVAHQLLATTYVPVDTTALVASNLTGEIALQLVAGEAADRRALPTARPDRRSWLADSAMDQQTVTQLQALGVNQVVVPSDALAPSTPANAGMVRPVEIQTGTGTVPAAVVDPDLTHDLALNLTPPLVAQLISAELSLAALGAPDLEQGTVMVPPEGGIDPGLLGSVLHAIEANPLAHPVTLDEYFGQTRPASGPDGEPIVRTLLAPRTGSLGASATLLSDGRLGAAGVTAMVPTDQGLRSRLDKLFLLAARAGLKPTERATYFDAAGKLTVNVTKSVQVTDQGTVTLTATTDQIPYIITNVASTPVIVLLHLTSSKLEFPDSPIKGVLNLPNVTLKPGVTQMTVRVKTLARATFPMTIEVRTPDGRQILASSELKVRATALSGVGIALTIGAAAVLVLWWVRQIVRHRRERRRLARAQHPAGQEPATSLAQP